MRETSDVGTNVYVDEGADSFFAREGKNCTEEGTRAAIQTNRL